MAICPDRIREIERATLGQAQNPLWHEYRKVVLFYDHFDPFISTRNRFSSAFT